MAIDFVFNVHVDGYMQSMRYDDCVISPTFGFVLFGMKIDDPDLRQSLINGTEVRYDAENETIIIDMTAKDFRLIPNRLSA